MASKGPKTPRTRVAKPIASAAAPEHDAKQAPLAEGAAILAQPFAADEPAQAPAEVTQAIEEHSEGEVVPTTPAAAEPAIVEAAPTVAAIEAAPAPATQQPVQEVSMMTTDAAQTATDKTQTMFADMNERTRAAMEKGSKGMEELSDMAKGNVEALVEASRIAARGFESLGQEAAEFGRRQFEQTTQAMKSMASVKSPTELLKLQGDFMRSAFDQFVAEASKSTESMLKLAGDAAQPLSNRVAVTANKFKAA